MEAYNVRIVTRKYGDSTEGWAEDENGVLQELPRLFLNLLNEQMQEGLMLWNLIAIGTSSKDAMAEFQYVGDVPNELINQLED